MYAALIAVLMILVCAGLTVNNQEKTVNSFKNGQTVYYFTLGQPAMLNDRACLPTAHIPKDVCPAFTFLEVRSLRSFGFVAVSTITLTPGR